MQTGGGRVHSGCCWRQWASARGRRGAPWPGYQSTGRVTAAPLKPCRHGRSCTVGPHCTDWHTRDNSHVRGERSVLYVCVWVYAVNIDFTSVVMSVLWDGFSGIFMSSTPTRNIQGLQFHKTTVSRGQYSRNVLPSLTAFSLNWFIFQWNYSRALLKNTWWTQHCTLER